jgi:predicted RNA methylase
VTERYKRKNELDKFYTDSDVAKDLISGFDLSKYKLIIEPSAGDGSFSRQIPDCLAFDIDPKHDSIIKQDFLSWEYVGDILPKDILCIGNPPFGKQGTLAFKFLVKCMSIADTVAFILPPSFNKQSIINKVPLNFHISKALRLKDNSFSLEGSNYKVPSIFQVWERRDEVREIVKAEEPIGYSYVKKNEANLAIRRVGFYAGQPSTNIDKNVQTHYFLKTNYADKIIELLTKYQWEHNNTVGPRSISKIELNKILNRLLREL